jgi:hypothetical protein
MLIDFSLQQQDTDDATNLIQQALADQRRQHSSKIDSLVDFARWAAPSRSSASPRRPRTSSSFRRV